MAIALNGERTNDRRGAKPIPGSIGERLDASGVVRRFNPKGRAILVAQFVAGLNRISDTLFARLLPGQPKSAPAQCHPIPQIGS